MLDGVFRNPTTIYFGKNCVKLALDSIPAESSRVLIIYGKQSICQFGLLDLVRESLETSGIFNMTLGDVRPNPTADLVYTGIDKCRSNNINFILAVGGGSVIDTAKSIAIGVPYSGDFFDFYERKQVPDRSLPVGTILTISGSGSESSDGAVVTKDGAKYACGSPVMYPLFSALDPSYTQSVPKFLTACGVVDAISHVLERYLSKTPSVLTSTELCEGLIRSLIQNGIDLLDNLDNYDLRAEIMWASKLAHDNTVGFGRKHDWASHTIAHELGARYDKAHGALLAVILPAWMTFMQPKHPEIFARFAAKVFNLSGKDQNELGIEGIAAYRSFLKKMNMPYTLSDCLKTTAVPSFDSIAEACCATTVSGTIGNFERLSKESILNILTIADMEIQDEH